MGEAVATNKSVDMAKVEVGKGRKKKGNPRKCVCEEKRRAKPVARRGVDEGK